MSPVSYVELTINFSFLDVVEAESLHPIAPVAEQTIITMEIWIG